MTQVFEQTGQRVAVTLVEAGPCVVLQVKRADGPDGYNSVQLGFDDVKPHRSTMPEIGRARKAGTAPKRFVREIRMSQPPAEKVGELVTVEAFTAADVKYVDVVGTTKGKGYQGAMRRHGFGGQPASHGTERKHRAPGSIGGHASNRGLGPIKKGKRMSGRTGGVQATARCQALVGVDAEHNLLMIQGTVPGSNGQYVLVRKSKTRA